ncbi:RNA polymerase sigma factor [Paracoccus alkanivorans]|uniref:RNA polymerase sigma factor n=1 Tax=Paracoccus alkanivorans TaxID=2116655 RepID=A0A3M0MH62_9RHOB|nr:RNA polymerase sigma factor [Paracoccus alkanivorans]RMC35694.1 RNA polymerase sigma factor [Paracoccus alkanivorans]
MPPIDRFEDRLIAILPNLHRFALSLCRKHDIAEDLVQVSVIRALEARNRFDPETRIEPWVFRILRNAWIDMTRRGATRGTEIEIGSDIDPAGADGEKVTEARLMLNAVERVLEEMPEEQREVLILFCYEEMSYAEIAEILDVPRGTVMSRLARARLGLAKKLGIK